MKTRSCTRLAIFVTLLAATAHAQIVDTPDGTVASIPVNYTEAKSGNYTLPDPLKFADGRSVADAKAWFEKRRPEIFKILEENQYGRLWSNQEKKRVPGNPTPGPARGPGRNLNVMQVIERGYALAVFNYIDIDPDTLDALPHGIRAAYLKASPSSRCRRPASRS